MRRYRVPVLDQQLRIHQARIELEAGEFGRIVAELKSGHCSMELYEEDPEEIYAFAVDRPMLLCVPPRRLRLDLDALFEQMTVTRPPGAEKVRER